MTTDAKGNIHRPAGSPASSGGQFDQKPTPGQSATLEVASERPWVSEDSRPSWGTSTATVGGRSPWGEIDTVSRVAPGIDFASTPGHGGYKLSPERNAAVPAPLRERSGWYEEDSAFTFLGRTFPEAMRRDERDSLESIYTEADETLRDDYPDAWEQVTGRTIEPGESRVRDLAAYDAANEGRIRVGSNARPVDGVVTVHGRRDGESFLMRIPAEEYAQIEQQRQAVHAPGGFADDRWVVPTPKAPAFAERTYDIDHSKLTGKAADFAGKRYRDTDGSVVTELQLIERRGVTGRRMAAEGTKRVYYVDHPGSLTSQVPKALWDALPGPIADSPQTEINLERAKHEKTAYELGGKRFRSREEDDKLRAARTRLAEMARESNERWDADRARFTEVAARREAMTTEETFYADYQAAIDAAAPWTTDGVAGPDVPAEVRERIEQLKTWGRDHKMLG